MEEITSKPMQVILGIVVALSLAVVGYFFIPYNPLSSDTQEAGEVREPEAEEPMLEESDAAGMPEGVEAQL